MSKSAFLKLTFALLMAATLSQLAACSPKYNWREVHGKDGSFTVLLPAKPVTATRRINLGGQQVDMTMTAAEVDGVNFAVGYATLADPGSASAALTAMQESMIRNINGKIKVAPNASSGSTPQQGGAVDIEAVGMHDGETLLLIGRFAAKGNHVFQAIVLGNEKAVARDEAKTFLASFSPN
jgi:hypothetical protein